MSTPESELYPEDIADAGEAEDSGSQIVGALSSLGSPPTTPEAQGYARQILKKSLSGETEAGEKSLMQDLSTNAESARAALRAAREKLMGIKIDPREQQFARLQAAFAPTHTGRFGEGLGIQFGEEANLLKAQRELEAGKSAQDLDLSMRMSGVDTGLLNAKLALQKLHEQQQAQLAGKALTVLGRQIKPPGSTGQMSPFGKIAQDEGHVPGTPDFQARVQELSDIDVANKKARAGVDVTGAASPADKIAIADSYGVPATVPDPWAGQSTKVRTVGQQNDQKAAQKRFDLYPAEDAGTQAALRMIDEFQQLNKVTHTGPELAAVRLGGVHAGLHGVGADVQEHGWNILNPLSWAAGFKPSIQRMDKIANNLVGLAIPPKGFGRVTNLDMGIFQRGMLSVEKHQATNDAIAQGLKIRLQNDLDRHQFEQQFAAAHGHTKNWENYWNQYLNDNPIFDPANKNQGKAGNYTLNPHRLSYTDYFRQHNAASHPQVSDADRADPTNAGLSDEEIAAAKVPAKAEGGPVLVKALQALKEALGQRPPLKQGAALEAELERIRNPPPAPPVPPTSLMQPGFMTARQAEARGGSVGFAEGGEADSEDETPWYKHALAALRSGATGKLAPSPEDPESPMTNFGGEVLGGAGTAAALLALAKRFPGAARLIPKSPTLRASLVGTGAGALAGGAGSQDEGGSRMLDTLGGGITGAMAGPLARLAGRIGVGGVSRVADRLRGLEPISTGARKAAEAISSDNPDWNAVAGQLRSDARARIPSTLGEVGPRTQGLAAVALGKDTPESAAYAEQLENRQAGAGERVGEQVNKALAPSNYLTEEKSLRDQLYTNAKPLYEQAYAQHPAVKSQALMDLMNTPSGQEAATRAFKMMKDAQVPIGQPDATGMIQHPSLQYLDYVKRSLDDMIGSEEGRGINYQATSQGRILRDMRKKLVSETDAATAGPNGTPGLWHQARAQYAGDLEVSDALRKGRDDFPKFTPDELRQAFGQMSFAEKDAFRSGVAEGLFNKLGSTTDTANPARRISSMPALREKLTALFDKPSEADAFLSNLDRESALFESGKPLTSAAKKGQAESVTPKSLATAARTRLMRSSTAGDISSALSARAGPEAQASIARLRAAADRLKVRSDLGNAAGTAAAGGAGIGLTPSPMISPEQEPPPIGDNAPGRALGGLMRKVKKYAGGGEVGLAAELLRAIKSLAPAFDEAFVNKTPAELKSHLEAIKSVGNESQIRGQLRANQLRADLPEILKESPDQVRSHLQFINATEGELQKSGRKEADYLRDWYGSDQGYGNQDHPLTQIANSHSGLQDYLSDTVESRMSPLRDALLDMIEGEDPTPPAPPRPKLTIVKRKGGRARRHA